MHDLWTHLLINHIIHYNAQYYFRIKNLSTEKNVFFCIFSVDQIFDRLLRVQETSLFFPALQHHGAPPPSFTIHTSTVDGGFTCLLRYKSISSHKICRAHQELCSVRKGATQARGPQLYLALCCWYKLLV